MVSLALPTQGQKSWGKKREWEIRRSSGERSGVLAPHGEEGVETFEMVHFLGDMFPEPSTLTPACLPCPRGCPPPPDRRTRPAEETWSGMGLLVAVPEVSGHVRSLPGALEVPRLPPWLWATAHIVEGMEGWAERKADEAQGPGVDSVKN